MSAAKKKPAGKAATPPTGKPSQISSHDTRGNQHTPPYISGQGPHVALEAGAISAAETIIHSWTLYGIHPENDIEGQFFPTPILHHVAEIVRAEVEAGKREMHNIHAAFESSEEGRRAFIDCTQTYAPEPPNCARLIESITRHYKVRERWRIGLRLLECAGDESDSIATATRLATLEDATARKPASMIVWGVNDFPTETPPEDVILGNGWLRRGDIANLISTAGAGKSVAVIQAAIAWGLGLPYLGITPPRPLRILLFSGEDDKVTLGQCREGLKQYADVITGRDLTESDLEPLKETVRTEFIREHVGMSFHTQLARLLREEPADLVIINPLLSYIGGEIVANASEWLRGGLMPVLQTHDCAALIAHHTNKMGAKGWDEIDDTYSAIGGSEMANIPRSILTLRPTPAPGLSVVTVSKRQTTGWRDEAGNFETKFYVQRSGNPERPAWIPIPPTDAEEMIAEAKPEKKEAGASKKAPPEKVAEIVNNSRSEVSRKDLIARTANYCDCKHRTAQDAVVEAERKGLIVSTSKPTGHGGQKEKFYTLGTDQPELPNQ